MRSIYLFMALITHIVCAAEILTTNDFCDVERACLGVDRESLVLFDVDDTLIVPNDAILQPIGKDLFDQLSLGAGDRNLFRDILLQAPHSLVDGRSVNFIHELQEQGVRLIALTAAPAKVRDREAPGTWRVNELKHYGFDFQNAFPQNSLIEWPHDGNERCFPMFKQGILYTSFHSKGDVLMSFLQEVNWRPKRVVFVDDELKHIQSVVACLEKEGIPCLAIHYTAAHEELSELNPELARFQVDYFVKNDVWLSDFISNE